MYLRSRISKMILERRDGRQWGKEKEGSGRGGGHLYIPNRPQPADRNHDLLIAVGHIYVSQNLHLAKYRWGMISGDGASLASPGQIFRPRGGLQIDRTTLASTGYVSHQRVNSYIHKSILLST